MKNGVQVQNIPFVTLYERKRDGQTYFVGRLGNARILIVPTEQRSRGDRVWEGVLAMGPHPPEEAAEVARRLEVAE